MVMAANGTKILTSLVVPPMVTTGPIHPQVLLLMTLGKCLCQVFFAIISMSFHR